jgi:hypothetical protein
VSLCRAQSGATTPAKLPTPAPAAPVNPGLSASTTPTRKFVSTRAKRNFLSLSDELLQSVTRADPVRGHGALVVI